VFGDSEPEDALPELDEVLHTRGFRRPRRRSRGTFTDAPRFAFRTQRQWPAVDAGGRRWLLWLRVCLYSLMLVVGLLGLFGGLVETVGGYSDAATMASAPTCPSGIDLTDTTENCVGNLNLQAGSGAFDDGGEGAIGLGGQPSTDAVQFEWVTYPGNAAFNAAVGDGPSVVRAEFWEGQIVTLTAGTPGVIAVTTDQNPNNRGGSGLGAMFVTLALVLLSILLFIGIRAFRLRWLRPGLALRLSVSGLSIWFLGLFVAGVCLTNQPARVALVLAIAPAITAGLTALVWLALAKGRGGRVRRAY